MNDDAEPSDNPEPGNDPPVKLILEPISPESGSQVWRIMAGLGMSVGMVSLLIWLGGDWQVFAFSGLPVFPWVVLAVFAYGGEQSRTFRVVTVVFALLFAIGLGLMAVILTAFGVMHQSSLQGDSDAVISTAGRSEIFKAAAGATAAAILGMAAASREFRGWLAPRTGLDPESFVHAVGLAALVTATVCLIVPLICLGTPPILLALADPDIPAIDSNELSAEVYALLWVIPGALIAVGFPVVRTLGQAWRRLGMAMPTRRQFILALVFTIVLIPLMAGLDFGIIALWRFLGLPTTDDLLIEKLFKFAIHPLGAIVIGVCAGLGEELAIRGVLQPRLGIWLSNLFFTSLHALQYHFDGLLSVFVIGLVLGFLRKYTNTTTSAIVHGLYDFGLLLLMYWEVPGFR
jgi:membrane protease YdiL (CAAX protease family)